MEENERSYTRHEVETIMSLYKKNVDKNQRTILYTRTFFAGVMGAITLPFMYATGLGSILALLASGVICVLWYAAIDNTVELLVGMAKKKEKKNASNSNDSSSGSSQTD